MRILIAISRQDLVGGAETYVKTVASALEQDGHTIALVCESGRSNSAANIISEHAANTWCISEIGSEEALTRARSWKPDVVYCHGLHDPQIEDQLRSLGPLVYFVHTYTATCITAQKYVRIPESTPCNRRFGPRCLAHYYPRRCGGLNPLTMWREYGNHSMRLALLRRCSAIVTASEYMRRECLAHGLPEDQVHSISLPVSCSDDSGSPAGPRSLEIAELHLLFAGRMLHAKGGALFVQAAPHIAAALERPLRISFAGDGPARPDWEQQAHRATHRSPHVRFEFTGWLSHDQLVELAAQTHLLVVPSIWPEPLGLVGLELGLYGVPAAAFAVGGIPEWLVPDVNGSLAPANPPTAAGLTTAVVECLNDPIRYQKLCHGARLMARQFTMRRHLDNLLPILTTAAGS